MTPTQSLLYVCQSSQAALTKLTRQLEETPAGDSSISSLLGSIQREADVLSASLAKLAANSIEELPEPERCPPSGGMELLDIAQRIFAMIDCGGEVCRTCGGVRRPDR